MRKAHILFLAVVTLTSVDCTRVRQTVFTSVSNESGVPLQFAFAGIRPEPKFLKLILPTQAKTCEKQPGSVVARIVEFFLPTAHAQNCGSGGACGGHYAMTEQRPCGDDCGGGCYDFFYSDTMGAECSGWLVTGGSVCGTCHCAEGTCSSCGGGGCDGGGCDPCFPFDCLG